MESLPNELVHKIFSFLDRPNYIHSNINITHFTHQFFTLSLVNRKFNLIANRILYETVVLSRNNILRFAVGLLYSVRKEKDIKEFMDFIVDLMMPWSADGPFIFDGVLVSRQQTKLELISNASGNGRYIKRLWVPSYDYAQELLQVIVPFVQPKILKYIHPLHGSDFIPTLRRRVLELTIPLLDNLQSIGSDDVDSFAWLHLITMLPSQLKTISIEACSEKDPFNSRFGLGSILSAMNLSAIRLDGVPIGSIDNGWGGDGDIQLIVDNCKNLQTISIDFCDITMKSFYSIWNNLNNLQFLGLAGMPSAPRQILKKLPSLKTLRFVDCQVDDELIGSIALNAPNLNMVRIVFEYPGAFHLWSPHTALGNNALLYLAEHCRELKTLALSRTHSMDSGMVGILENGLEILDWHATTVGGTSIGRFGDDFFIPLSKHMKKLRVLNLFDQKTSEQAIIELVKDSMIESICLNGTSITNVFMEAAKHSNIRRLSVVDCNVSDECIAALIARGVRVYVGNREVAGAAGEDWFTDESLDIFSLWHQASLQHLQ